MAKLTPEIYAMGERQPQPPRLSVPGLVVSATSLAAVGFLPLFAGLSYEAALAAGLILPTVVAVVTARSPFVQAASPLQGLAFGLKTGACHGLLAIAVTVLHGLRVQICDPAAGLLGFLLGPVFGALMGGAWGALIALGVGRTAGKLRRWAGLLAFLGPLGAALVSVGRFYTSPIVFAYDPFVGYFAGPLYETVLRPQAGLLWYRVGSLGTLVALAAFASLFSVVPSEKGDVRWRARPWRMLLGVAAGVLSLGVTAAGTELGHFSTTASIRETLGRSLSTRRCELVYSKGVQRRAAELLGKECDAQVKSLERFFDTQVSQKITVFLFASAEEKGALMGAARTFIAKPWRHEVYVQQAGYPHPVLGHELAHVVAGNFANGPFAVAGPLAGWVPDPGRIEGFAVAASPSEEDDLTLQEWAQAMQKVGLLPRLESVFRLGFLGQNAGAAYTVAGSFVQWLHQRYGAASLRQWYAGASVQAAFGKDLFELESEWHRSLNALQVSEQALKTAQARFDQPGVFGRACPHVVDSLFGQAAQAVGSGDPLAAEANYRKILELDAHNLGARLGLSLCADRRGDVNSALRRYAAITQDQALHWAERVVAEEASADILLRQGKIAEARTLYAKIAQSLVDEDRLRTLDVKSAIEGGLAKEATVSLLIGEGESGASWDVAAPKLGQWFEREPDSGLPGFLLGKNLFLRGYYREAGVYLDRALARKMELPRVRKEALRVRLLVACAGEDRQRATQLYSELLTRTDLAQSARDALVRFGSRCQVNP